MRGGLETLETLELEDDVEQLEHFLRSQDDGEPQVAEPDDVECCPESGSEHHVDHDDQRDGVEDDDEDDNGDQSYGLHH